MRKVMRPRYYCDHCKKAGGSAGHMKLHEAGCTANPERKCRMCPVVGGDAAPLADLVALVKTIGKLQASTDHEYDDGYYSLDAAAVAVLRERAGDCPVCMFAALRQAGAFAETFNSQTMKGECGALWAQVNEEKMINERHYE